MNLDKWEQFMTAAGLARGTIALRLYHLKRLETDTHRPPDEHTTDTLIQWLADSDLAPNTRRTQRGSLRAFYQWLSDTTGAPNPAAALPPVRVPRALPRPVPDALIRAALAQADGRTALAVRLAAICGLRVSELAQAHTRDLCPGSLRVRGKGGHARNVPLPPDLHAELAALPPGPILPSHRNGEPMTPAYIGKLIRRLLPPEHTAHALRHRAATEALDRSRDMRAVQELLGHARLETTAIYTAVRPQRVRAALAPL